MSDYISREAFAAERGKDGGKLMRNKDRIRPFCERLAAAWERCPDMRFGQLICNAFSVQNMQMCRDPFFIEDDVTIYLIEKLTDKSPYYPPKEERKPL